MRVDRKFVLLTALLAFTTMGAKCISVNDDGVIVVNIENVTGTYNITQGATLFANPNDCVTKQVSDYLDSDYGVIKGGRLVDIQYQAFGVFAGNINGGTVSVNGVQILSYSGPWSTFTTRRSLLLDTHLTRHPAGVTALLAAVENQAPIVLCVGGTFSAPAPSGLSVVVEVFAQVDVEPN
jgi:hypothetical protein